MYFSDAPQIEEISINKMITKYKKIKPSFACVYYQNGNSCPCCFETILEAKQNVTEENATASKINGLFIGL